jgi:hypothetical protein
MNCIFHELHILTGCKRNQIPVWYTLIEKGLYISSCRPCILFHKLHTYWTRRRQKVRRSVHGMQSGVYISTLVIIRYMFVYTTEHYGYCTNNDNRNMQVSLAADGDSMAGTGPPSVSSWSPRLPRTLLLQYLLLCLFRQYNSATRRIAT